MKGQRTPTKITLDAYAASRAVAELKGNGELSKRVLVRTGKYLVAAGVDVTAIRSWLGHAYPDSTNRYSQPTLGT